MFSAQYLQSPIPAGGGILEWAWFQPYHELPNNGLGGLVVQSWDTAMMVSDSSSYTVCTTWWCFNGHYFLIDVWRHRRSSSDLPRIINNHAIDHQADVVVIELTNGSTALIETLCEHSKLNLMWDRPKHSKAIRMEAESPILASGKVHVPEDAGWLESFRAEIVGFPEAPHDDQVDSLSQFLYWTRMRGVDDPHGFSGLGRPGGPPGLKQEYAGNVVSGGKYYGFGERRYVSTRGINLGLENVRF